MEIPIYTDDYFGKKLYRAKVEKFLRDKEPPKINGGIPCGACREFLMQLSYENRNMEILTDYESRKTVLLKDLVPNWWGDKRYNKGDEM